MAKMKLKTLSGAKKRFKMTAAYAQVRRQDQRGCRQENDALRWLITKTFKGQLLPVTDKGDIKHGSY